MFARLFKTGRRPIGCSISGRVVRCAQLASPSNAAALQFITAESVLPPGSKYDIAALTPEITRAITDCLAAGGFRGRNIVTCLPESLVRFLHVRLADMPDEEMESAVYWQTAKELSWKSEDLRAAHVDLGAFEENGKKRREVIAVAASLRDVDSHADSLIAAGLSPLGIDVLPAAIARCVSDTDAVDARFVVALGPATTQLMVVRHGALRFIRSVTGGRKRIVELAARMLPASASHAHSDWSLMHDDRAAAATCRLDQDVDTHRTMSKACDLYARELKQDVSLCLHHLGMTRQAVDQPRIGCVFGAGPWEQAFLEALDHDITFEPLERAVPTRLSAPIAQYKAATSVDAWLPALGLAMYACDVAQNRAAA